MRAAREHSAKRHILISLALGTQKSSVSTLTFRHIKKHPNWPAVMLAATSKGLGLMAMLLVTIRFVGMDDTLTHIFYKLPTSGFRPFWPCASKHRLNRNPLIPELKLGQEAV